MFPFGRCEVLGAATRVDESNVSARGCEAGAEGVELGEERFSNPADADDCNKDGGFGGHVAVLYRELECVVFGN